MFFTPYRLYHKPPLRGGSFFVAASRPSKSLACRACERVGSMVARREVMTIQAQADGCQGQLEQQCTFELKGAE